jgi:hypothetical protein
VFHGIEIDPTAVEIATVAMWLTDHQMNQHWASGYKRIPLISKANIHCGNALRTDWETVLPAEKTSFIVGNPPFLGSQTLNPQQRDDMKLIHKGAPGTGVLDYVTGWYIKAFAQIKANPLIKAAFVSTNSITQGEQVSVLWQPLFIQGLHIQFAHRTFKWSNEGSGVAAVHCVIVGFGLEKPRKCDLWDYSGGIAGDGRLRKTRKLNAYLVDAAAVFISSRRHPICNVPPIVFGSMPNDGGSLLLKPEEKAELLAAEPNAAPWIKPFMGADEFLNNGERWCLWLKDCSPQMLAQLPNVQKRVEIVLQQRIKSTRPTTKALAATPTLFGEDRQPTGKYLLIPLHSSENRSFLPIGFFDRDVICGNANSLVPSATTYHFGLLSSTMHNAWTRAVCGRIKSDYRYSNTIVYNNYPWPSPSAAQLAAIETAGQAVLDARALHTGKSLAWLYNPETLPKNLQNAHDQVDDAVDEAYGYDKGNDDTSRVAYLFELYEKLTLAPLLAPSPPAPKTRKAKATGKGKT